MALHKIEIHIADSIETTPSYNSIRIWGGTNSIHFIFIHLLELQSEEREEEEISLGHCFIRQ